MSKQHEAAFLKPNKPKKDLDVAQGILDEKQDSVC